MCLGCDRDGVVRKHKHGSHPPEAREHTGQFLRTLLCFLPGDSPKQSPGSSALPKTCGRQPLPAFLFLVHSGVRFGFSSRSPLLTPDGPIRPVLSQRRVHKSVSPVSPSCSPPWPWHRPLPQSHIHADPPTHKPLEDSPHGMAHPYPVRCGISEQNSSQFPKPFLVICFFSPPVPRVLHLPLPGPRLFSGYLGAVCRRRPGRGIRALALPTWRMVVPTYHPSGP